MEGKKKMKPTTVAAIVIAAVGLVFAIVTAAVLAGNPELNDTIGDIRERLENAQTVNEQLRQLMRMHKHGVGGLDWTYLDDPTDTDGAFSNIRRPVERLPRELEPDLEGAEPADALPEELRGARFLALWQYGKVWDPLLLGDFQVRLPKGMRAETLEEADAVLLLHYEETGVSGYIGGWAHERNYRVYAYRPSGQVWLLYSAEVDPPSSGTSASGVLTGEAVGLEEIWAEVAPLLR